MKISNHPGWAEVVFAGFARCEASEHRLGLRPDSHHPRHPPVEGLELCGPKEPAGPAHVNIARPELAHFPRPHPREKLHLDHRRHLRTKVEQHSANVLSGNRTHGFRLRHIARMPRSTGSRGCRPRLGRSRVRGWCGGEFRDEAAVLGPTLGRVVLSQVNVATAGGSADGDDGLTAGFVEAVGRDARRSGHGEKPSCGRLPQLQVFRPSLSTIER